jgi:NAD-dependent dihydropyrimidine dehydrogenase PreA subunit
MENIKSRTKLTMSVLNVVYVPMNVLCRSCFRRRKNLFYIIDQDKCIECGTYASACPNKTIIEE